MPGVATDRASKGAGLRSFRRGDDRPHPGTLMFDPSGVPAEFQSRHDALAARFEDAGLTCSQPPQQSIYDGWLLRYSPGKAKRAKSVNAAPAVNPFAMVFGTRYLLLMALLLAEPVSDHSIQ